MSFTEKLVEQQRLRLEKIKLDNGTSSSIVVPPPPPPGTVGQKKGKKTWAKVETDGGVFVGSVNLSEIEPCAVSILEKEIDFDLISKMKVYKKGLYFLETKDGWFVMKSSNKLASAVVADRLAERLGVKVPFSRLISYGSTEYSGFTKKLCLLGLKDMGVPLKNEEELVTMQRTWIKEKCFVLMEFVKGPSLLHYQLPAFMEEDLARKTLKELGRIVGYDMLINNWDRFPVPGLWKHDGNFGNSIVKNGLELVAIDNAITNIESKEKRSKYIDAVFTILEKLKSSEKENLIEKSVTVPFLNWMLKELQQEHLRKIITETKMVVFQQGVLEIWGKIEEMDKNEIKNIFQAVKSEFLTICECLQVNDPSMPDIFKKNVGLDDVNDEFVCSIKLLKC